MAGMGSERAGKGRSLRHLSALLQGELRWDLASRMAHASDASHYQVLPLAVARPRTREHLITLVQFAVEHGVPLIPRAAGTSLAGQAVGSGIVVDTARHLTRILSIDPAERTARVEPGVVLSNLNRQSAAFGLKFAPDPSTLDRATIAGAIGNNAWGAHAPRYGTTRDHVRHLELITGDGNALQCRPCSTAQIAAFRSGSDRAAVLHRGVMDEIESLRPDILQRFPDPAAVPCNMGYALHVLARAQPWVDAGAAFNLSGLVCGSEGTLGLIAEATVALVPVFERTGVVCAHFHGLDTALQAVAPARRLDAVAVELLDRRVLSLTCNNLQYRRHRQWIVDDPAAVLLVEFAAATRDELQHQVDRLLVELKDLGCYAAPWFEPPDSEAVWAVRRASLGLLMGTPGPAKPVTLIEDSAVPVAVLPQFVKAAAEVLAHHGMECVYYGSVGMGLVHLRPLIDLHQERGRQQLAQVADDMANVLLRFGGTLSAKHGDGRLRAPFLEKMLGSELAASMRRIKDAFDPHAIFNPGKVVAAPPIDSDLRVPRADERPSGRTYFSWEEEGDLFGALERCHGAGVCRKRDGVGTMCPSYRALGEELHTTRGRATVFRQLLVSQGWEEGITSDALHEAVSLCLSCKGCRSECPANVDMARFKAEHLQHYQDRYGVTVRTRIVQQLDRLAALGMKAPRLFNALINRAWIKRAVGFHPQRVLPLLAPKSFSNWMAQGSAPSGGGEEVVLLNDLFTEYFDVEVGRAAVDVLERLGFRVVLSPCFPSPRTVISQGLLRDAAARVESNIRWLDRYAARGVPIIGLEPSELLTYRDEAPTLVESGAERERAERVGRQCLLFEEFLLVHGERLCEMLSVNATPQSALIHVHCHQKSLVGTEPSMALLSTLPGASAQLIPSGCCGMAGVFGYEQEHSDLSRQIGELALLPAVRAAAPETVIVATGTSCRHQIAYLASRTALHPAQWIAGMLQARR